jgi:signal transduction histidine kinase
MNTASASRAEAQPATAPVLVWDAPVRLFHWLLLLTFAGAWLTSDGERWRMVHVTLGYTMAGLVAFRVLWGLFGTRHARFAAFVRGPAAVVAYLKSLLHVLVRNLVDNAARYSPPQARIAVHLAREGRRLVLAVEDSGPGLADADLAHLGQRFFRLAGSEASGSGLGWSIVRRIADLHGAEVAVQRSAALGGMAVRISLPAAGG